MTHYYTDNSGLASQRKSFDYYFDNEKFSFTTDNGVFSKDRIDYGSYLLIKNTYKRKLGSKVLDLGCGYGPVGIIIKRFNEDIELDMADVNPRAYELAEINSFNNKTKAEVHLCENILTLNKLFDSIILNPPVRAGKLVVFDLYARSYACLNDGGSLYIVIQKKQGADSSMAELAKSFKTVEVLDKDGGYRVIRAVR
ncbi:MAG: class I SAM-dependent methyltransferase [Erysipelotrichaceae bacterium]|nr:class I SAM-dependent methyltransferase [Erysipelotrichaceae bacterium]